MLIHFHLFVGDIDP